MKRKTRRILAYSSMMLFPLTLNYFSPFLSVHAAIIGIASGSIITFLVMMVSGIFFRRAWCSYVCPWAAPSEILSHINDEPVNRKTTRRIRYTIFTIWLGSILLFFILAGGIPTIEPLYLTERIVSMDEPIKFVAYYTVVIILTGVTLLVGRRGSCQTMCWMSPFLEFGAWIGRKLGIRQYRVRALPSKCITCTKCNQACPMSIDVMQSLRKGQIDDTECIQCGDCVDVCPTSVLSLDFKAVQKD
ncbi:MAG: 4Fe-4S binding protein [Acholeplasmataceae bacterium]